MTSAFATYLSLLREISRTLVSLTETAQQKTAAVRQDNLAVLNECLKREQALSLSLRGFEQKRAAATKDLGFDESIPLSGLAAHYPVELQPEAKAAAEELLQNYQLYRSASEVARSTLECNLHQIEKVLAASGEAEISGAGYDAAQPEPPAPMKTDFRA